MLGNLRISFKLTIMVALSIVGAVAVAAVGLSALKNNLMEDRKAKLRELVLLAQQVVDLDYQASRKAGLSEAETLKRSKDLLRSLRYDETKVFFVLDRQGVVAANANPKLEGMSLLKASDSNGVFYTQEALNLVHKGPGSGFVSYRFKPPGTDVEQPSIAFATGFKPLEWVIGSSILVDDVDTIFWMQVKNAGAVIAIVLLLTVGLSFLLGRGIVKPILEMTVAMRRLAGGDSGTDIPALQRGDEVGAMAQSVQVFKESMLETARLRGEQDVLKERAEAEKKAIMDKMADGFELGVRASLDTLYSSASGMRTTSASMSAAAGTASSQATTVAAAAQEATLNVQTVAAATEQLSSSVTEISRQVSQSTAIASKAVEEANRTNGTVQGLAAAAAKIGDVVKLISDIASQTNLLALNATIEAARAGEAGKGFAVVANEVKSLASQTAKATEEISTQVSAMQNATDDAVHAIERIGGTISSVNEITMAIASAVEEQGAATQEIARNVQRAAERTGQVSHNIVGVNQAASETGAAAGQVLQSVDKLMHQSGALRADVDSFLADIRAA